MQDQHILFHVYLFRLWTGFLENSGRRYFRLRYRRANNLDRKLCEIKNLSHAQKLSLPFKLSSNMPIYKVLLYFFQPHFVWLQVIKLPCSVGLPLTCALKTAMTGVELLVDRAQLWEQSAAKHVSIGTHLEKLLSLARRWRQIELSAWKLLSQHVIDKSSQGKIPQTQKS